MTVIQTHAGMPTRGTDGTIEAGNHPHRFCIQGACFEAITAEVFFDWKSGQSKGSNNLPATAAQLSDHARKPYAGWTS